MKTKLLISLLLTLSALASDWREKTPIPVFEKNPAYVDLYWKAWETAYKRVKGQPGIPHTPYMDEACWDSHVWIWDTAFMAFFTKYSAEDFPGIETLKNFYLPMFGQHKGPTLRIQHPDNPPLFAWCEYANWKFNKATSFGKGKEAAKQSLSYMKKYYQWFNKTPKKVSFGGSGTHFSRVNKSDGSLKGFRWSGVASGMDNTVRGRGAGWGKTLWLDAISQQALAALYISRMAKDLKDQKTAVEYKKIYAKLKKTINELYWDEEEGVYYDIHQDSTVENKRFVKVLTPASVWPMLAEVASKKQAKSIAQILNDPKKLGGDHPIVTLSRDDPQFNAETGNYWRGGIWMPTSYMTLKALQTYKMHKLANELSERTVKMMLDTYNNKEASKHFGGKSTIWECYNPTADLPSTEHGKIARPEFCGWSALGPISLFIENVIGIQNVDARKKKLDWRLHQKGKHGLKNFRFGEIITDLIYANGQVKVQSNKAYRLRINGKIYKVKKGYNRFRVERT